jgi:hypothetical protein
MTRQEINNNFKTGAKPYTKQTQKVLRRFSVILALLFSVGFAIMPILSFAAELNLISQTQEINTDQQFQVDLILNTEGEQINAIEGKIVFPEDLLEVKEIRDGNSIINFWIDKPKAETLKNTNTNTNLHESVRVDSCGEVNNSCGFVYFSGITPGGYNGNQGLILSIIFLAKKEGSGLIEIQNAKTLLNDGKGTEAQLKIFNFQFSIFKESPISQTPILEIQDTEPPEDFQPEISRDPAIFDGKWFLVFATQDKGSGIDHYEIRETKRKIEHETEANWVIAESPYLLKDQKLQSYIYVKAVDKAGNERIIIVSPKNPLKWYEKFENWVIIILLAVLVFYILRKILWKIYTKQH